MTMTLKKGIFVPDNVRYRLLGNGEWRQSPIFNVMDYGAAGDGVTDDSAAVQAAIMDAVLAVSGIVYAPKNTYKIVSDLICTSDGTRAGTPHGIRFVGDGTDATKFTYQGNGDFFTTGTKWNAPPAMAMSWSDFSVDGTGSGSSARGAYWKRFQQASGMTRVKITNFGWANTHFYKCFGVALHACQITASGGWNIIMDGANGFVIGHGTRYSNGGVLVNTKGGLWILYNQSDEDPDQYDPTWFDEPGTAMVGGLITGTLSEDNHGPAIKIERSSAIKIKGWNYIEGNGITANAATPGVNGQVEIVGTSGAVGVAGPAIAASVEGAYFNGNLHSVRGIYHDNAQQTKIDDNFMAAHATCDIEGTSNGWWYRGLNRTSSAVHIIDNTKQDLAQATLYSRHIGAIPFTHSFILDSPDAGLTNAIMPLPGVRRPLKGFAFAPGAGDIKGATTVTAGAGTADAASDVVNAGLYIPYQSFTAINGASPSGSFGAVSAQPAIGRNLVISLKNTSGGSLNLFTGSMVFTVIGTFRGQPQTDTATLTLTSGQVAMANGKFRRVQTSKPFDTITSVTVDATSLAGIITNVADAIQVAVGPGTKLGLPMQTLHGLNADIIEFSVNAVARTVASNFSATNQTLDVGTIADGDDVYAVYNALAPTSSASRIRMPSDWIWEINHMTCECDNLLATGSITFYPVSNGVSQAAQMSLDITTTDDPFEVAVGNCRCAAAGDSLGVGYTTTGNYVGGASEIYVVTITGYKRPK